MTNKTDELLNEWEEDAKQTSDHGADELIKLPSNIAIHQAVVMADRVHQLIRLVRAQREVLNKAREAADKGYHNLELSASVVTMDEDDFYSCCGYVRDLIDKALALSVEDLE
jgi:hypothetical protein